MAFITEDSDDDSIATNTTEESEHDEDHEFNVEEVLAEDTNEHDEKIYLVKWEGYPLHRCTWEGRDAFNGDFHLQKWRAKKAAAKRGAGQLFDLDEFYEAVENAAEQKQERARRRQIKRRKRNEGPSRSQSPIKPTTQSALPRRPSAALPVKKKGVAQKVVKKSTQSGDSETRPAKETVASKSKPKLFASENAPKSNSAQPARKSAPSVPAVAPPLIGPDVPEMRTRKNPRVSGETPKDSTAARFRNLSTQNKFQKYSRNEPPPDVNALTMIDLKTGRRLSAPNQSETSAEPVRQAKEAGLPAAEHTPQQPELTRQVSAPVASQTQQEAIPTPSTFFSRRPSEPATAEMPKLPAQPEPVRRTTVPEAAPPFARPEPVRGAEQPAPTATNARAIDIHSAYGRRTPPTERRCRTPSPPAAQPVATNEVLPKKLITCRHWQAGSCRFTAETCWFKHGDDDGPADRPTERTAEIPAVNPVNFPVNPPVNPANPADWALKKATTCYYWRTYGRCKKSAEECQFAHEFTGIDAGAPGTYLDSARKNSLAMAPSEPVNQIPVNHERRQQMEPFARVPEDPRRMLTADKPADEASAMPMDTSPMVAEPLSFKMPARDNEIPDSRSRIAEDLSLARKAVDQVDMSTILSRDGKHIENVYVLMPPERAGERKFLIDLFEKFKCKVFDSGTPQHWKLFTKFNESVIIIHPSETFNGTLPGFAKYMLHNRVWVFSLGVHETWDDADQVVRTYEARRVFPHGIMTFISDDVFAYYPEKATAIIQAFHTKAMAKPKGGEISKIGARPGIRNWLADLAAKKMEEGGEGYTDDRYVKCWDALCDLCPLEHYDPWEMEMGHMVPKDDALLWSVAEEDLPSFQGLWEKDEAKATDMMANFFAGSAVEKMGDFQRYCFVYQRPDHQDTNADVPASQLAPQDKIEQADPRGWMKRYNHVEVFSPDQWLRMHQKKLQEQQQTRA